MSVFWLFYVVLNCRMSAVVVGDKMVVKFAGFGELKVEMNYFITWRCCFSGGCQSLAD